MGLSEYARHQPPGSSSSATLKPPPVQRIGNYELGELIGVGGMGNVYKARHAQFERTRAVKIIKPSFVEAGHEEIIRRFYREIKAIGGLDHPNIVVAIDSSSPDDQTHYLVMEYVDGVSAERLADRYRRLPLADACEIVRQAAVGLEYIHRQGMVHRDIKPSNLMLTTTEASSLSTTGDELNRRPLVKILDLGLALLVSDDQQRFTQAGHGAMGTAMYMSPEQWMTTSVDIRADIYSLGCTLHHLLTGKPPFYDSDLRPQRAHERSPTPSLSEAAAAPAELDWVLERMMAKSPEERYARPADVAEVLAPFCEGSNLLGLLDQAPTGVPPDTNASDHRETLPAGRPTSDTHIRPSGLLAEATSSETQPRRHKLLTPLAILAAVVAVIWMGSLVRRQQTQIQEAREKTLVTAARPSARALASEISERFETLIEASRSEELLAAIGPIAAAASPPPPVAHREPATKQELAAWSKLQTWIERQKTAADDRFVSSSWFVTDRYGRQIARQKKSSTIGGWFYDRDYFHGQGALDSEQLPQPISGPHQSGVYRSKTTKLLKVAFSVPIVDGQNGEVLGVLAMSVNLGDFRELEDSERLPDPLEVVLVDLRHDVPEQRGLLLHHRELEEYENPENPFRLPAELLRKVDAALKQKRSDGSPLKPIIRGYGDLLQRPGRGLYVGAVEPVVIRGPEQRDETGWLVIVQEEIEH